MTEHMLWHRPKEKDFSAGSAVVVIAVGVIYGGTWLWKKFHPVQISDAQKRVDEVVHQEVTNALNADAHADGLWMEKLAETSSTDNESFDPVKSEEETENYSIEKEES